MSPLDSAQSRIDAASAALGGRVVALPTRQAAGAGAGATLLTTLLAPGTWAECDNEIAAVRAAKLRRNHGHSAVVSLVRNGLAERLLAVGAKPEDLRTLASDEGDVLAERELERALEQRSAAAPGEEPALVDPEVVLAALQEAEAVAPAVA